MERWSTDWWFPGIKGVEEGMGSACSYKGCHERNFCSDGRVECLVVVVDMQRYTCDNILQNYAHTLT